MPRSETLKSIRVEIWLSKSVVKELDSIASKADKSRKKVIEDYVTSQVHSLFPAKYSKQKKIA